MKFSAAPVFGWASRCTIAALEKKMRTIIALGGILLTSASAAQAADRLPSEILGAWCNVQDDTYERRPSCRGTLGQLVLGANGYHAQDGTDGPSLKCKAIGAITKVRSSWQVRYACTGDASLTETVSLYLDEKTGQLIMSSKAKLK
jgi:hypothetical protein